MKSQSHCFRLQAGYWQSVDGHRAPGRSGVLASQLHLCRQFIWRPNLYAQDDARIPTPLRALPLAKAAGARDRFGPMSRKPHRNFDMNDFAEATGLTQAQRLSNLKSVLSEQIARPTLEMTATVPTPRYGLTFA